MTAERFEGGLSPVSLYKRNSTAYQERVKSGPVKSVPRPPRLSGLMQGTRLLTPTGYRPVESLRAGDWIGSLIGRGPMFVPITWVGVRDEDTAAEPRPPSGQVVRIRRHAIADNMPSRDVLLAPDHAIYLKGALLLVGQLVNGMSIQLEPMARVREYWGVKLERHDILLAENLPVESLLSASLGAFRAPKIPKLHVVGAERTGPSADAAVVDFPASIRMSVRWFRRRFLNRPMAALPSAQVALDAPSPGGLLNVEHEIRRVLELFRGIAKDRQVSLKFAVDPGLKMRFDQMRLQELVGAMLTHAIHGIFDGHVLIGAMQRGDQVHIAVIDKDRDADRSEIEADLRQATFLAAIHGATLEFDIRSGEGATLLLRLPAIGVPLRSSG